MAIIKSAKKAIRSSARKRDQNLERKQAVALVLKKIKKLVGEKKQKEALALLSSAYQALDKAVKRGVLKANTASRKKSRLVAMIKRLG